MILNRWMVDGGLLVDPQSVLAQIQNRWLERVDPQTVDPQSMDPQSVDPQSVDPQSAE